jgi:hypothetical protein
MHGLFYSSDNNLTDNDLCELADALAVMVHNLLGTHVFLLQRADIRELIAPYVCDLEREDQKAIAWMVWHLFQEARDIALQHSR